MRISEKHGVNPTMGLCFFCGQEDGTIGLLGRLPNDAEGPRRSVLGYEPCSTCKSGMSLGIALIECDESARADPDRPPIQKRAGQFLTPTGRWFVIKREAALRIFTPEMHDSIMKHGRGYISPEAFDQLHPQEGPKT